MKKPSTGLMLASMAAVVAAAAYSSMNQSTKRTVRNEFRDAREHMGDVREGIMNVGGDMTNMARSVGNEMGDIAKSIKQQM